MQSLSRLGHRQYSFADRDQVRSFPRSLMFNARMVAKPGKVRVQGQGTPSRYIVAEKPIHSEDAIWRNGGTDKLVGLMVEYL